MGNRGNSKQFTHPVYSPDQIKAVLGTLGVDIDAYTYNHFLCFCPFHGNRNTPSFQVHMEKGIFYCFNPGCGESGTILGLVCRLTRRNRFEALRFLSKKGQDDSNIIEDLDSIFNKEPVLFSQEKLDELNRAFPGSEGHEYMKNRGFEDDTLKYFHIGYSDNKRMVTVPVHSYDGKPLGLVGRSIDTKKFKNSVGLPRQETLFNIHRAKREGGSVIFVEASFDVMRLFQAGFPNAVALLGAGLSPTQFALINRHFAKVTIMTDNDDPADHMNENCRKCINECVGHSPGKILGKKLAAGLINKEIYWSLPIEGCKDPCDMTDDQINHAVKNSESDLERLLALM
jgi:DNA primase